ncbi:mitochondrial calcium uniporter regulator 1-like [Mya arenaria]|uniref:mitochondrial calcium uniporter regulator 1-like n=1 Tax=Mya arenaria TaxID=6604 RepID=UPI0022E7E768|nr:mitochondrial calcium uniporter regulator 1-like [Mya arenaria]
MALTYRKLYYFKHYSNICSLRRISNARQIRLFCDAVGSNTDVGKIGSPAGFRLPFVSVDTLTICKRFRDAGFEERQAEIMTQVLYDVIQSSVEVQGRDMVSKTGLEVKLQQLQAQIRSVQKDMVILEKSEFTMIRNDTEKQGILIKHLESKLDDAIKKLEGNVKLDINLEKSRAIEAHAINEKNLQSLLNRIEIEHTQSEKNLQSLDNKIEVQISMLKTQHEKSRNTAIYTFIGMATTACSLYFAYLRLIH